MHPSPLREVRVEIAETLALVFQCPLGTGVVPEDWKIVQKSSVGLNPATTAIEESGPNLNDDEEGDSGIRSDDCNDTVMMRKEMEYASMQIIAELEELETQLEIEKACRQNAEGFTVKGDSGICSDDCNDTVMMRKEMEYASMQIIAELEELETQLEIEKACRQNAEGFAVKLTKENQKLQRLSLALQPVWDTLPSDITHLALQDKESPDPTAEPAFCYQLQVKEFQERISHLLEEKRQLAIKVQEMESRLMELMEQVEKEHAEKMDLQKALERQNKNLQRFNTVSSMVTHEYEELRQHLELEQDLRHVAENYAHQMRVQKQEANRQSMILLENVTPSTQLLKALEEVANATKILEEERIQHEQQVKELQEQIEGSDAKKEIDRLQVLLQLAEDEKEEMGTKLQEAETRNTELETKVKNLQEKLTAAEEPVDPEAVTPSLPPPPPPPPLPPPPPTVPVNPLAQLLQRRQNQKGKANNNDSADLNELKLKAVDEMMERIKSGVVLKPMRRKLELLDPKSSIGRNKGSAVHELKGILNTMTNRKVQQYSWKSEKKQSELEGILQRRRKVTDITAGPGKKDTENPAVPHREEWEAANPGLPRASNSNQSMGLKRGRWMQQSRRTSEITALNRRKSQGTGNPEIQPLPGE
ncbi:shootin-1 isoform X2 [Carcharodon carcharias]|uniref:shootin-1 isoform X2 n=1 Tax=Carcharodon carcharias TaxID=13397 RepID=UPI001B7DEC3B|nr:shootin-1 isoform X2 [Carcharodon carcharias]